MTPCVSFGLTFAPYFSKAFAISRYPRLAAMWSGVQCLTPSAAFTLPPVLARARTTAGPGELVQVGVLSQREVLRGLADCAAGGPIDNRPQLAKLPHKERSGPCAGRRSAGASNYVLGKSPLHIAFDGPGTTPEHQSQ